MFFELNGKTYQVRFRRDGLSTFAIIFEVQADGTLRQLEGVGFVTLYYKDRYSKSQGRKEALADLLWKYQVPEEGGEIPEGLDKEARAKIWAEYFKVFKK